MNVRAGHLQSLRPAVAGGWHVALKVRGTAVVEFIPAGWVVNCTGPSSHAAQTADALMAHLIGHGAVVPDLLGLGLCVEPDYRLNTAPGVCVGSRLRYVGPLLKAVWWEAVAVPELRVHADKLAGMLVCELGLT